MPKSNDKIISQKLDDLEQQRWQDTLEVLEDIAMGRIVDGNLVHAWLASWGKDDELYKLSIVTKE